MWQESDTKFEKHIVSMKIRSGFTRHGIAWEFLLSNIFDIGISLWEKRKYYHTDHKVIKTLLVWNSSR